MTVPTDPAIPNEDSFGKKACPQCGHSLLESPQWKVFCANCGYKESWEDLFPSDSCETPSAAEGQPDREEPPGGV